MSSAYDDDIPSPGGELIEWCREADFAEDGCSGSGHEVVVVDGR